MVPAETAEIMQSATRQLADSGLVDSALTAGSQAPDFNLPGAKSAQVNLYEELKNHAVVLSFFRGAW